MCVRLCSTQAASEFEDREKREKKEMEIRESVILTDNTVCEFSIRADRDAAIFGRFVSEGQV